MFPDSEIAKKFSYACTKTTTIVKVSLAPHYTRKVIDSMSAPFSLLMDESNDKRDKSYIILVRVLHPVIGEVCTRSLDLSVVNIGTANILLRALKSSLEKSGLSFEKAASFMSDTTNVRKEQGLEYKSS